MLGVEGVLQAIPALGSVLCIGIIILILVIVVLAFFLSLLIEFLPATLIAILVYLFTGNLMWTVLVFVVIALLMSLSNRERRRRR
ncbi:MAG: hypothetical protein V5A88_08570 [Candidatus Thermoplasmatota archaeon]